jgi:hypothetical protein
MITANREIGVPGGYFREMVPVARVLPRMRTMEALTGSVTDLRSVARSSVELTR